MTLGSIAACTGSSESPATPTELTDEPVTTRVELGGVTHLETEDNLEETLFNSVDGPIDLTAEITFKGLDPLVVVREPLGRPEAHVADAARADVIEIGDADVPSDAETIATLREDLGRPVIVMGDEATAADVRMVRTHTPLPTATYRVFGGSTHYIGLYGHPNTARMGLLGEQGPDQSVDRLEKLLSEYRDVAPDASFHGLFEIITTVATGGAGTRGAYSQDTPIDDLKPLVDAAGEAGVLVVLDLQPGREDFLTQAKRYESLLVQPHVGLALDPEWRLGKNQVHLRQIGSVTAAEVNQTADWLAALVREHSLPQKLFVIHQFRSSMIRDRGALETGHRELATMIHVDGQGTTGAKFSTWRHLLEGAPAGLHWGWKNFIDEDPSMLSPKETWGQVDPKPGLVTYQ